MGGEGLVEVKSREKGFAPPAWRLMELLTSDQTRWLRVTDEESTPSIASADQAVVVWTSLWPDRPDDRIRLENHQDEGRADSSLRWTLMCPAEDVPDDDDIRRFRYRIDQLLNGQMRDW